MGALSFAPLLFLIVAGCASKPNPSVVRLPDGTPGIGFDDLRYSVSLHRLLVPAGRSGRLDLVEPDTLAVTSIPGFSATRNYSGGHDHGPTSVEEALGKLYVTDRTSRKLFVVDPTGRAILSSTALAAEPDYVRFVALTRELWVSEPSASQFEIFKLGRDGAPAHDALIAVDDGPESIVVDGQRGRLYTHRWHAATLAFDVAKRVVVAEWPNGCAASRGIALDEARGWLFSGCSEGTVTVADVVHGGRMLSSLSRGSGFDVIGYSEKLGHLYLAGGACRCFLTLGVSAAGKLTLLERRSAPPSSHCAAADDAGHAWVCDPDSGTLLRFEDVKPRALP